MPGGAGVTDEGNGETLFLNAGTVQTHIANLFVTLGVNVGPNPRLWLGAVALPEPRLSEPSSETLERECPA